MSDRVTITLELELDHACALARLCDKFAFTDAHRYLYPHVDKVTRDEQAYQMTHATYVLFQELSKTGVNAWPWIEHGRGT